MDLESLGWSEFFSAHFEQYESEGLVPARVAVEHHGFYELVGAEGRLGGIPSGRPKDDVDERVAEAEAVAFGVPVHAVSNVSGEGLDELERYLQPARTVALLGSSGVGKSTLANCFLGHEVLKTAALRADGRGRHTTTRRQLVQLPGGALLLDTPGLRELQLWAGEDSLEETFADVTELAAQC